MANSQRQSRMSLTDFSLTLPLHVPRSFIMEIPHEVNDHEQGEGVKSEVARESLLFELDNDKASSSSGMQKAQSLKNKKGEVFPVIPRLSFQFPNVSSYFLFFSRGTGPMESVYVYTYIEPSHNHSKSFLACI